MWVCQGRWNHNVTAGLPVSVYGASDWNPWVSLGKTVLRNLLNIMLWVSCCARVMRLSLGAMPPLPCVHLNKQTNLNKWWGFCFHLCRPRSYEYVNGYMQHLEFMATCVNILCVIYTYICYVYICATSHVVLLLHMRWCHSMPDLCFTLCFTCQRWVGRDLLISNAMMTFWSRPTHPSFPTPKGKKERICRMEKHERMMQCMQFQMSYAMTRVMRCCITSWDWTPLWPQSQKTGAEPQPFPTVVMQYEVFGKSAK